MRLAFRHAGWLAAAILLLAVPLNAQQPDAAAAQVTVVNQLDRPFLIWVNGEPRGLVEAGGQADFADVEPGSLSLLASGVGTEGIVASEKRVLAAGQTFQWTLYPRIELGEEKGTARLILRNALDQEVDVELGGNPVGRLAPGGSRTVTGVVAGDVTTVVSDLQGNVLQRFALTIIPDEIMVWTIR